MRNEPQDRSQGTGNYSPHQPAKRPARKKKKSLGARFVDSFIPTKRDSGRELVRKILLIIAVVVLVGSAVYITNYFGESKRNEAQSETLRGQYISDASKGTYKVSSEYEKKGFLEKFWPLYEQNEDVAGWINIPDTKVDYPVVQTDNNKDYDRTDFYKKANQHGIPFVDYRVDLMKPSTNTVIYSHNMADGQMFGELMGYKSLDYYRQHPLVTFDSVYEEAKFKIFAIVLCEADDPDFPYHNFINAKSDAEMSTFIGKIRERSMINTTVDVQPSDKLLTLSTCDYSFKGANGEEIARFVVFGRKVRPGESAEIDVAGAKLNTNPVMPAAWYDALAKKQAAELERQKQEEAGKDVGKLREEASKWFTSSELSSIADDRLETELARRKETMAAYLSADELSSLNADQKVALLNERLNNSSALDQAMDAIYNYSGLSWMNDAEVKQFAKELILSDQSKWNDLMKQKASQQSGSGAEVSLDRETLALQVGDSYQLNPFTSGGDGGAVKWSSDSASVASVDGDGYVTANKQGTAVITISYGGRAASCKVTVTEGAPTTISLPKNMEVAEGQSIELYAEFSSEDAESKGVKWGISGGTKDAVSIEQSDLSCVVYGERGGKSVEITAMARDGSGAKATCRVTVKSADEISSVTLDSSSLTVPLDASGEGSGTINAAVNPSSAKVKWSASGEVQIVDQGNDYCTFVARGSGKITASISGASASCSIKVKQASDSSSSKPSDDKSSSSEEDSDPPKSSKPDDDSVSDIEVTLPGQESGLSPQ